MQEFLLDWNTWAWFPPSQLEHNNDQIQVKTKQLAWRMTAQPYNQFVFMLWSWHLPCNGNKVTIITIIGLTIVALFYTLY